jgi:RNA polymerase sigma factor (sigma-70 family)
VLTGRERVIIYLRFYESVSQTEIAKRLNVSQMHVSRLQAKALEKLRSALGD